MSSKSVRYSSFALILVLALSGLSFGFLVGQSHRLSSDEAVENVQTVTTRVHTGGALVAKAFRGARYLLIK